VLTGNVTRELRRQVLADSDDRIRLMTIGNTGGWLHFANTQRTVRTPADMVGLRRRTSVAERPQELLEAVGASPTPIRWPDRSIQAYASFVRAGGERYVPSADERAAFKRAAEPVHAWFAENVD